jgi:type IV secretory pathway VirB10-like protein
VVVLLPIPARADYKESYRKGMEAVDRKQWPEAAKRMQEALAENPKEGESIRLYGSRFETYLPYFYLGHALVNTGDCDGAVKAFATSEEQGAIGSTPKRAELVEERKKCEARVAKAPPTPQPTSHPTPRPTPPPEPTAVPPPTPASRSPEPSLASPTPAPSPEKQAAGPSQLLAAARAYFEGRYGDAASALASAGGGGGRATAQALLLRSASRYALFRIGGEQDAPLLKRAAEDAAAARRADPSLMPDEKAFSPAFVKFFRESR